MVTSISNGDYIKVKSVDFGDGANSFEVRAASGSSGGSIELHLGSQTGTLVGTCNISGTGGWDRWENFKCDVSECSGVKDLFMVFKGSGEPFRLNWYIFVYDPSETAFRKMPGKQFSPVKVNYSNSKLQISFIPDRSGVASIKIYDLSGKVIKSEKIKVRAAEISTSSINLSNISRGYYVVKVSGNGTVIGTSEVLLTD